MTTKPIKSATVSDQDQTVAVVVLAFSADPVARWSYPDPHEYLKHFPDLVRALGGQAFAHGSAYYVDGFSGAALWLPPDVQPLEEEMTALLRRTAPGRRQEEIFSVLEQMGSYHPTEPHWYLPLIGVDPAQQGNGYGSALMEHALIPCDRENKPAYLESTNPRNIPLYKRHGFELMGTIQVGSSPPIFPMLRRPQAR
jgi:ribosomal protein S18 acetylase RimI-like enzyme